MAQPGFAVVNVEATRVVFNAGEMVSSVNLINSGETPALVQLWFDEGDISTSPEEARTPVIALPPVFRLQPGELRDVKLQLISRDNLPRDKESLYWLNIYQVPPNTVSPGNEKRVILPLRLRLKVFIRPSSVSSLQEGDGKKLQFGFKDDNRNVVIINNPSPWFMTISSFNVGNEKNDGIFLAPGESKVIALKDKIYSTKVQYEIVNDNGNRWSYIADLKQSLY